MKNSFSVKRQSLMIRTELGSLQRVSRVLVLAILLLVGALSYLNIHSPAIVKAQSGGPQVELHVVVERVKGLDCFDGGEGFPPTPCTSDPDFFAMFTIDGEEFDPTSVFNDQEEIMPGWEVFKVVDFDRGSIDLTIAVLDQDGDLLGGDHDRADLIAGGDRNLDLTVNLRNCLANQANSVSGDLIDTCNSSIVSAGNGNDSAEIEFRIFIERTPSAPGTNVFCIHDPIWPQPNEPVTFTARALDGTLQSKIPLTIEIYLNRTNPSAVCPADHQCSLTIGAFVDFINYGCLVKDTNDEHAWTGWRRVFVGDDSRLSYIPVIVTGRGRNSIDIMFIADQNTYGTSPIGNQNFIDDVGSVISNAYYAEEIFLANQNKINFSIAKGTGIATSSAACSSSSNCHKPPGGWNDARSRTGLSHIDVGVILHNNGPGDYALPQNRIFSAGRFPTGKIKFRTVLHETGHVPFGLEDEYCCNSNYSQPDPFPNIYETNTACAADAPNLGRTAADCRPFPGLDKNNKQWYVSDPPSNDLMVDDGIPQAADIRRINWLFDLCRGGRC